LTDTATYLLDEHETDGKKSEGKISKARKQLKLSLENLLNISGIRIYTDNYMFKRCCFFSKQKSNAPQEISATTDFNRSNTLSINGHLNGNQMPNSDIENLGFEYWEFYGNQTYLLEDVPPKMHTLAQQLTNLSIQEIKELTETLKSAAS
jgi:hypothetical protein